MTTPVVAAAEIRINGILRALAGLRDQHPRDARMSALMHPQEVVCTAHTEDCTRYTFEVRVPNRRASDVNEINTVELFVSPANAPQGRMSLECKCASRTPNGMCQHTFSVCNSLTKELAKNNNEIRILLMFGEAKKHNALFASLDALIDKQELAEKSQSEQRVRTATERLIWKIRISHYSHQLGIEITPLVQQLKKDKSSWKKGTRLGWPSMRVSPLIDGPQDEAVAKYLFSINNFYAPNSIRLLECLAGSPRVVIDRGGCEIPVAIHVGPLGLSCDIRDDRVFVNPTCGEIPIDTKFGFYHLDGLRLITIGDSTIQLVQCKLQEQFDFAQALIRQTVGVPLSESAELLSRVAKLSTNMPVITAPELTADVVDAERTTYLEMVPTQPNGLIARLRTRPNPAGKFICPGDARFPTHFPTPDGKVSRIVRDAEQELAEGKRLVEELDLKQFEALTDWDYRLLNDDQVIDFIVKLSERQSQRITQQQAAATSFETAPAGTQELIVAPQAPEFGKIPDTDDLVVTWPQGGMVRVTREIESSALQLEVQEHDDWFGLNGQIVVDGHAISLSDVLNALKAGRRVVPLGNGLFARISDEFYDRLLAIGDVVYQSAKGMEVDITSAPVLSQLVDISDNLQLCQSWRDIMNRLDASATISTEPPISLNADLRSYQLEGYRWLKRLSNWGVGGCLADDMGLGKTLQALAIVLDRVEEGPTLVIAPMSVGFNWMREAQRFAPSLNVVSYRDHREEILKDAGEGDVVIVSYPMFQREAEKFWDVQWGTVILDEAQNIKNATTKTARAVRDLNAKWKLALTGTPIENQLSELWALFRSVTPGLFGSWDRFRERFVTPIEKNNDSRRRYALARMVKPFILRRTKDEVLKELPDRTEVLTTIELSDEERKLYEAARVRIVADLMGLDFGSGKDHRIQVLAGITKLRQLACHPALCDKKWKKGSSKLEALLELVSELKQENHRALIFSQFTQHLGLVRKALEAAEVSYQYLDGSSTAKQRAASVDAFQAGEGDVFLISLKAGGTGLNLTAADYVIHLDPWWNPAVEDQATDRAHRIGQTRPVTVYRLVTKDTIEEKILSLHDRKRQLVSSVLEGSDEAAKLSTDELIDLIKTSGTAAEQSEFEMVSK